MWDGATGAEVQSYFAYAADFAGGVWVAAGDVTGDGVAEVVTGTGIGGGPHVKLFDGATARPVAKTDASCPRPRSVRSAPGPAANQMLPIAARRPQIRAGCRRRAGCT